MLRVDTRPFVISGVGGPARFHVTFVTFVSLVPFGPPRAGAPVTEPLG